VSGVRAMCRQLVFAFVLAQQLLAPPTSAAEQNTKSDSSPHQTELMTSADKAALSRALAAYDQGRADEAEPVLRNLVRRYPGNFEAAETLGLIYAEGGDLSSALSFFERACVMRPSSALAHANLGAAYLKSDRIEDAVRVLKRSARPLWVGLCDEDRQD